MAKRHTMTPKRRAALRKAQLASARKRRKSDYKAAKKKWKNTKRVKSHTKAVYTGAAVGTLIGGPGLGTGIGAYAASALNRHKHGKLPTHPRLAYAKAKKSAKRKKR